MNAEESIRNAIDSLEKALQGAIKESVDQADFEAARRFVELAAFVKEDVRSTFETGSPVSEKTAPPVPEGLELPTFGFSEDRFYRVGESQSRPDGYYRMSAPMADIKHVLEVLVEHYRGDNRFTRDDLKSETHDEIKSYVIDLVVTAGVDLGAIHPKGHGTYAVADARLCSLDAFIESFGDLPDPLR